MNQDPPPKGTKFPAIPITAIERIARAKMANRPYKPREFDEEMIERLAERFADLVNERVPGVGYWDKEGTMEEFDFLAWLGSDLFDFHILSCVGCSRLFLPPKASRGWCSVKCAKEYQEFCRDARRRAKRGDLDYQERWIAQEELENEQEGPLIS